MILTGLILNLDIEELCLDVCNFKFGSDIRASEIGLLRALEWIVR